MLDVFGAPSKSVLSSVDGGPSAGARVYRLSEELPQSDGDPPSVLADVQFDALQSATHNLVQRARREQSGDTSWFVAGHAPLPIFAQVGFELSAWAGATTHLNQRTNGAWDVLRVGDTAPSSQSFFEPVPPAGPSPSDGRVAVFISTLGNELPESAIRAYLRSHDQPLAGFLELRTSSQAWLTAGNASTAADELKQALSEVASRFPHSLDRGIVLFIAGPATLALLAGRAVNPRIVREVWIPNHRSGDYEDGVFLPHARPIRPIDSSAAARQGRARALLAVGNELELLRERLDARHLQFTGRKPPSDEFLSALRGLRVPETVATDSTSFVLPRERRDDGFAIKPSQGELTIGDGLCEALRSEPEERIRGIAAQLIVHELFHGFQSLTYGNFRDIGRAGVVLEEIDYQADVFAIRTLTRLRSELSDTTEADTLLREVQRVIEGIEAFDRAEQGHRIDQLHERRLRRYLIWWLQFARARRVRSTEDIDALFSDRLAVELAPLPGRLDMRHDKLVTAACPETALLLSIDGTFRRIDPNPNHAPGALVNAVRDFRRDEIDEAMERIVESHLDILVPWVGRSQ